MYYYAIVLIGLIADADAAAASENMTGTSYLGRPERWVPDGLILSAVFNSQILTFRSECRAASRELISL